MSSIVRSMLKGITTSSQRSALHSYIQAKYEAAFPSPEREHIKPSFSAWGEDLVISAWLGIKGIPLSDVRYLDLGAAYPIFLSNTYSFYRAGGSGVLVEPDPNQVASLRQVRPRDTVIAAGVTNQERGQAELIQLSSPVFNTFSLQNADKVVEQSKGWQASQSQAIVGRTSVEMIPITEIIDQHFSNGRIHVLSMDVEGMELPLIEAIDYSEFLPLAICVEASEPLQAFMKVLEPHGYQMIAYTPDNFVFLRI